MKNFPHIHTGKRKGVSREEECQGTALKPRVDHLWWEVQKVQGKVVTSIQCFHDFFLETLLGTTPEEGQVAPIRAAVEGRLDLSPTNLEPEPAPPLELRAQVDHRQDFLHGKAERRTPPVQGRSNKASGFMNAVQRMAIGTLERVLSDTLAPMDADTQERARGTYDRAHELRHARTRTRTWAH